MGALTCHQVHSGICSLSGGNKSQESSLMAGNYKENSPTNEGDRRDLSASN